MKPGQKKLIKKFDTGFRFVVAHNPALTPWADVLRDYWAAELPGKNQTTGRRFSTALTRFAIGYLDGQGLSHLSPEHFFSGGQDLPPLSELRDVNAGNSGKELPRQHDLICDFLSWLLYEKLAVEDSDGHRVIPLHLAMPFKRLSPKQYFKQADLCFMHVLKLDPKLEDWRALAAKWVEVQTTNIAKKREAIDKFLVAYVHGQNLDRNYGRFFLPQAPKPDFIGVLLADRSKGNPALTAEDVKSNNVVSDFLGWILTTQLGDENGEWDRSRFHNPVPKVTRKGIPTPTESNKSVLSIRYIKECRGMLAQGPNFRCWTWAHDFSASVRNGGDWFVVEQELIDRSDLDCVWRYRKSSSYERDAKGYPAAVFELWSPVRAVALYIKLELPLRLIQVRLLDGGEADTYRYEYDTTEGGGQFVLNRGPHATGDAKRPYMRGVFHRSGADLDAGLFINTNKSADIGKPESAKGYVIPWTNAQVLYWLSKLRNWQTKYNPLRAPTPWTDLKKSHFGNAAPHPSVAAQRGTACFLFRDPCASRPDLPILSDNVDLLWRRLLGQLEIRCAARGETLDDGEPLAFLVPGSAAMHFPLHALRVSLISYLVLDLNLPIAIVSKLIAGHATIVMTLYYTKLGHTRMSEVMEEADRITLEADQKNHRRFLKDATYEQVRSRFASLSEDAFLAVVGAPGAGLIFDDKGICPVGGAKCDVGGETISDTPGRNLFAPVPGYPRERNCVRCRFFLTGPAFLPALQAHFNALSARLKLASEHWNDLQQQLRDVEQERHDCEQLGRPFLKNMEIERLDQRNQEAEEACSKLLNDMQATYYLIERSRQILTDDSDNSDGVKLVASGSLQDVEIGFLETTSELHQLEVVCENAVIYTNPEATPAVLRRAQLLDRMLIFNRMPPVLMHMDEKTQLQVGNALMQLIKARAGSIQGSLPYAECQKKLSELGIQPRDLEAEMMRIGGGVQVQQLIRRAKAISLGADIAKEQE